MWKRLSVKNGFCRWLTHYLPSEKSFMVLSESKILVVDDDAAIRRLLVRFLSQYSYQIKEADTGQNALIIFEQFYPNLVILDINLPDTLGYHLCEQMQSQKIKKKVF